LLSFSPTDAPACDIYDIEVDRRSNVSLEKPFDCVSGHFVDFVVIPDVSRSVGRVSWCAVSNLRYAPGAILTPDQTVLEGCTINIWLAFTQVGAFVTDVTGVYVDVLRGEKHSGKSLVITSPGRDVGRCRWERKQKPQSVVAIEQIDLVVLLHSLLRPCQRHCCGFVCVDDEYEGIWTILTLAVKVPIASTHPALCQSSALCVPLNSPRNAANDETIRDSRTSGRRAR
jgi:hypothetical protein